MICGTDVGVVRHHAGGERHVAWFTVPLCEPHHAQLHELCRAAGINLEDTPDLTEKRVRALKAISICQWMLLDALHQSNSESNKSEKENDQ